MSAFVALALLFASTAFQASLAQFTNATCSSDFDWMKNSKGQSPCLAAAYLQSACIAPWTVVALPAGFTYDAPIGDRVNPCTCSSSVYNLMSACSTCQGQSVRTWPKWIANCASIVPTTPFPASKDVPGGTEIPAYALRLGENWSEDTFNTKEARLIAEGALSPDATGSETGSPPSSTSDPTPTNQTPAPSSDGPSLGPIIGGVVGGVLGLLLIATLAYYIRSKHKRDARNLKLAEAQSMILPQSPPPLSVSNFPIRPIPQPLQSYATSQGGGSSNPSMYHGHHASPSVESAAPYIYSPSHGHQRSLSQTVSMTHQPPPQMTVVRSNTTAQQNRPLSPQSPTFSDIYSAQDHSRIDEPFYPPSQSNQHSSPQVPQLEGVAAPQPIPLSEKAQLRERERQRQAAAALPSPAPPAYSTPAPAGHQLVAIGDGTETWVSGSSQAGATHGDRSGNPSLRDGLISPTSPGVSDLNRALSLTTRNGDELQSYLGLRLATQSPGGLSTYSSTAAGDMYGGSSNAGDWPNEKI